VESVSIWYNNLPEGQPARCVIGLVKALPMVACTVKNPAVTINGKTTVFPVEMSSGSYLELNASNDCVHYGSKGEVIAHVSPRGPIPLLSVGKNEIQFSSDTAAGPAPRVRLTVSSHGQPL
jgi:hypothetical protein